MFRSVAALSLSLALCSCSTASRETSASAPDASAPVESAALSTIAKTPAFAARLSAAKPLTREGDRFRLVRRGWGDGSSTLPAHAAAPLHLGTSTLSIDVESEDVTDVAAEERSNALVFAGARPGTDVVLLSSTSAVEELRVLHEGAEARARYRIRTGPTVGSLRVREGRIEVLDASGVVRIETEPAFAVDRMGARRALDGEART